MRAVGPQQASVFVARSKPVFELAAAMLAVQNVSCHKACSDDERNHGSMHGLAPDRCLSYGLRCELPASPPNTKSKTAAKLFIDSSSAFG